MPKSSTSTKSTKSAKPAAATKRSSAGKKSKQVRLGIIGFGNMGKGHLSNVTGGKCPSVRVTALCDSFASALADVDPEQYELFTDPQELIASGSVDAVLICTPHYDHTSVGSAALKAGLHVLVEKPISVHKADCEKLLKAYKNRPKRSQRFGAMFNQRTDAVYRKIKQLIDGGELGELRRVNWIITDWFRTQAYYDSGDWRATWAGEGGGVLLNQCPHQLDLLQWLTGMPARIHAHTRLGQWHDIEVEDDVTAWLEYPGGASGVFITTTGEAPGTNRLEIVGERGRLVAENGRLHFRRNEVEMTHHSFTTAERFGKPTAWDCEIPVGKPGGQHAEVLENFGRACLDRSVKLLAPGEEGINSVELANAMLMSGLTGKTVELPLSGASYGRMLNKLIAESKGKKKKKRAKRLAATDDFAKSF